MHLQGNTLLSLTLVTQNVALYPLHHVTFAGIKYEVETPNGLGGIYLQEMWQTDGRHIDFGTRK